MIKGGSKKIELQKGQIILFQGDSITDSKRNKEENGPNNARALGSGYAMLAGAALLEKYASLELKVFNKGISGDKVYQLAERWNTDCLEIKPDVLSILIGVNDIWHKYKREYKGTIEIYRNDYIALLERTKKALPDVKLIIGEPFAIKSGSAVEARWYPEFYEYQKAAGEIASQFGAVFLPFQSMFDEAVKRAPGTYLDRRRSTSDSCRVSINGQSILNRNQMIKFRLTLIFAFISSFLFSQNTITGILYSDNKPVSVTIKDGKISKIKRIKKLPEGSENLYLAPGLIDNQVNGFAGVSFTFGGGELTPEGVKKATEALWETGVTTYLPTLTTNSNELLKKNFEVLAKAKDDPSLLGSIPGFHLEGPFISPVDGFRGAHPLRFVRKPDWNEFLELNKASGNNILQVTIAPETEGAFDFISKCTASGILVATWPSQCISRDC